MVATSITYQVMEFRAAAKQIRAELMTIKTLLKDDRIEVLGGATVPGFRFGVNSPSPDDDESPPASSKSPNIFNPRNNVEKL